MEQQTVSIAEAQSGGGRWRQWAAGVYELPGGAERSVPMEGLRGLAVLLVFFVHIYALFAIYGADAGILRRVIKFLGVVGNAGVDLFFVVSGYLIYRALLVSRTDARKFLWRRAARLYPAFLAVFALYLILSIIFPAASRLHGLDRWHALVYLAQNLLFVPGIFSVRPLITPAWSLSYEAFFYLSATLVVRSTRMWTWSRSSRVLLFAALVAGYLAVAFSVPESRVRILLFVVGIVLHETFQAGTLQHVLSRRGEVAAIALFLGTLASAYVMEIRPEVFSVLPGWTAGRNLAPGISTYQGPYKTILLMISTYWFTAYCLAYDGILRRCLSLAPLRYLGNMSYSYYLIHGVTLQGVALGWERLAGAGVPSLPLFAAALPVGLVVTWITSTGLFVLVEKPFSLRPGAVRRTESVARRDAYAKV